MRVLATADESLVRCSNSDFLGMEFAAQFTIRRLYEKYRLLKTVARFAFANLHVLSRMDRWVHSIRTFRQLNAWCRAVALRHLDGPLHPSGNTA